jgi:hypothetical protein
MENKFRDKKAEDILTDENWTGELMQKNGSAEQTKSREMELAAQIAQTVANKKAQLEPTAKAELGQRVSDSIETFKRRKLIVRFSYAAVFILLVGISVFFQMNSGSDIRTFAQKNDLGPIPGNTRLILSGEKEVQINSDESKIEYRGDGNEIRIDAEKGVKQVVANDETVMNTVIVPYGKRAQITLSDNSKIWLNSGSKLIYPACFATNKREVYLEGEAIFEVSHNKKHPFIVITADLDVRVLGTVFNVSSYRDDQTTSTILESGSVELNYKSNYVFGRSKELMVPGMLAIYDPEQGNVEQSKVNTRHYTSWRDGYFIFEKQPLGGILKKISRYYNVSVRLSDEELGKETFSGNLDLKNSPDQVLKIIAELISAKVENIDNQIVITRI